jgi:type IV pilus assembly protein PilC
MPSFSFTARDAFGAVRTGFQSAESPAALAAELRASGLVVVDLRPEEAAAAPGAAGGPGAGAGAGLGDALNPARLLPATAFDVELGLRMLASMLRSGLTLLSALRTAADQARRPRMAAVWYDVRDRVEAGMSFGEALARHPRRFPDLVVQLVRAGEQSGTLAVVLERAAEQLERRRNLRTTLLSARMYPAIVVVMALGVAAFMVFKVIPILQKFLTGRGKKLPAITQALVDVSTWLQDHVASLGVGIGAAVVALVVLHRFPPTGRVMDGMLLRTPLLGTLFRLAGTAMFARGLGLLIENGVTLIDALSTARGLLGNRVQSARIESTRNSVIAGGALAPPLLEGRAFMPMLGRMVAVGEEAGTLGMVLAEVARFHEDQLAGWVRRLSVLVEPVITLVVGGIVGFVYIAFFVALFSLSGGGGR